MVYRRGTTIAGLQSASGSFRMQVAIGGFVEM